MLLMVLVLADLLLLIKTPALAGVFFRPCHRFSFSPGLNNGHSLSPGHGSGYSPGPGLSPGHGLGGRGFTCLLKNH